MIHLSPVIKKGFWAIAAALLFIGLAPAAEEKGSRFSPELLQELTAPIAENDIHHVSEPNSRGQRIIVFHRREADSSLKDYLALREADGSMRYFYHYHFNVPAPEVTHHILWLDDDQFACVASGRINSFYGVYEMAGEDDEYPALHLLLPLVSGSVHFRMKWSVQDKTLIGSFGCEDIEVFRFRAQP